MKSVQLLTSGYRLGNWNTWGQLAQGSIWWTHDFNMGVVALSLGLLTSIKCCLSHSAATNMNAGFT